MTRMTVIVYSPLGAGRFKRASVTQAASTRASRSPLVTLLQELVARRKSAVKFWQERPPLRYAWCRLDL